MKNCLLKNQQFLLKSIREGKTQGTLLSPKLKRQEKSGSHGLPGPRFSSKNCRDPVLSRKAYDWQIVRGLMWTTLLKTSGGTVLKLTSLSVQPCSTVNSEEFSQKEREEPLFWNTPEPSVLNKDLPLGETSFFFFFQWIIVDLQCVLVSAVPQSVRLYIYSWLTVLFRSTVSFYFVYSINCWKFATETQIFI